MISNEIADVIVSGVLSILGALASYGVTIGITCLKKKKEELITKVGVDKYNENYKLAQDIYYAVEQKFRFIPAAGDQKRQEFDKVLVEKIPGISQEELNHFRETICGKVNSEVNNSHLLAPAYNPNKDVADVVSTQNSVTPVQPTKK